MNRKEFTWYGTIIMLILISPVSWSISVRNFVLPVIAIILVLTVLFFLRSRVKEVTVDERMHLIHEKASRMTVQVFGLITVLIGFVLIALSRSVDADFSQSGFTLVYSACALLILHLVFRRYYRSKYGG